MWKEPGGGSVCKNLPFALYFQPPLALETLPPDLGARERLASPLVLIISMHPPEKWGM